MAEEHNGNSFLGLKLLVVLAIGFSCFIIISLIVFLLCLRNRNSKRHRMVAKTTSSLSPMITKEITEVKSLESFESDQLEKGEILDVKKKELKRFDFKEDDVKKMIKKEKDSVESIESNVDASPSSQSSSSFLQDVLIGWGRWYSYREIEIATNGFAAENVIGEGGYGVVYKGVLPDHSLIAVKNLFNNRGQAEQEFKVEVEAIGKVRHKNLVGLIGYCAEGAERMLIYEYVSNGNLERWLHGDAGRFNPLTWDVRMKIAVGTAKGIAYLHEGLEPKVVHRDIKSSNILLDKKWNPKVSDFGLAKLLGSNASHVTTRVMGTFGCVAPEYASSGRLNESSDVYSFGVLLMEIISGRSPVDYAKPSGEVNLVDWFKMMVANRRGEEVLDPRIEIQPSLRTLKRIFLVCLRCIDWDADKRPKMGQVVHMLEADDFPFRSEYWIGRDSANLSPHAAPVSTDDTPFLSRTIAGR